MQYVLSGPKGKTRGQGFFHIRLLNKHITSVFKNLTSFPVLANKTPDLEAIQDSYKRRHWSACVSTILPLFDHLAREVMHDKRLGVTGQSLSKHFADAGLSYEAVAPGYGLWTYNKTHVGEERIFSDENEDLRLLGVYLSSFLCCFSKLYQWSNSHDVQIDDPYNRHAILHGAATSISHDSAARLITLLDLFVRLFPVLEIVLHGPTE